MNLKKTLQYCRYKREFADKDSPRRWGATTGGEKKFAAKNSPVSFDLLKWPQTTTGEYFGLRKFAVGVVRTTTGEKKFAEKFCFGLDYY